MPSEVIEFGSCTNRFLIFFSFAFKLWRKSDVMQQSMVQPLSSRTWALRPRPKTYWCVYYLCFSVVCYMECYNIWSAYDTASCCCMAECILRVWDGWMEETLVCLGQWSDFSLGSSSCRDLQGTVRHFVLYSVMHSGSVRAICTLFF